MGTKLQEMIGTVERLLKLGEANPFSTDVTEAMNREGVLFALRYLRELDKDVRSDEARLLSVDSQIEHLTGRVGDMQHRRYDALSKRIVELAGRVTHLELTSKV